MFGAGVGSGVGDGVGSGVGAGVGIGYIPSFVPDEPPEHAVSNISKKALNKIEILRVIDKLTIYYKQPNVRLDYINAHVYVNH